MTRAPRVTFNVAAPRLPTNSVSTFSHLEFTPSTSTLPTAVACSAIVPVWNMPSSPVKTPPFVTFSVPRPASPTKISSPIRTTGPPAEPSMFSVPEARNTAGGGKELAWAPRPKTTTSPNSAPLRTFRAAESENRNGPGVSPTTMEFGSGTVTR